MIRWPEHAENPPQDFVLLDAVSVIEQCGREGRTVVGALRGGHLKTAAYDDGALLYGGAELLGGSGSNVDDAVRDVTGLRQGAESENTAFRGRRAGRLRSRFVARTNAGRVVDAKQIARGLEADG